MPEIATNFDPTQISAATTGFVAFAPKGSTAPSDAVVPLDPAFKSVGLVTDDGITFTPGKDVENKAAFNVRGVVARIPRAGSFTAKFIMMQNNPQTHQLFFGQAPTTLATTGHTRTGISSVSDVTPYMYVFQFVTTAGKQFRWILPVGVVTDLDDVVISETDIPQYSVTVSADVPTGGGDIAYKLSNEAGLVGP